MRQHADMLKHTQILFARKKAQKWKQIQQGYDTNCQLVA